MASDPHKLPPDLPTSGVPPIRPATQLLQPKRKKTVGYVISVVLVLLLIVVLEVILTVSVMVMVAVMVAVAKVIVKMDMLLIVQVMAIVVQNHGLVTALKIVKIKLGAVT